MTKAEVKKQFDTYIKPTLGKDKVAIRCAWNDYIDQLEREKVITYTQATAWVNPYG